MSGTKIGSKRAVNTIKKRYGSDFYKIIGAKGGRSSNTGGFAYGEEGRERARIYGAIGGRKSRRGPTHA